MESLQKRILILPQELQDLIGSFNPKHRIMMRQVCEEIEFTECANRCGTSFSRVDAFTTERCNNTIYCCSSWCLIQEKDDYRDYLKKQRRF